MLRVAFVLSCGLVFTLLWDTKVILPLKLLAVLIHEIWHGFLALLGGALLEQIHVDLSEGGETIVSRLQSAPLVLLTVSAGYLGSAFTGGLLLNRGLKGYYERLSLFLMAAFLAYMSRLFTGYGSLAFTVGMGWSAGLVVSILAGAFLARGILLFLGTFLVWYALYDLLDFTWVARQTDAGILAAHILKEDWWIAFSKDEIKLAESISVIWSFLVVGIVAAFSYPMVKILQISAPQTEPEPTLEEAPGEVDEWLLSKGFQWNGREVLPLDPDKADQADKEEKEAL